MVAAERKTADQRREEILVAAFDEFAAHGLHGTSTDVIARKAGVSQPYLFRLFGTKKELYLESVRRCLRETLELFREASAGKTGEEALDAMGRAYVGLLEDRRRLRAHMQAYADGASGDPQGPERGPERPRVDCERLHADLRRALDHRRRPR